MVELPPSPIAPSEFFESFLPRAFAEAEVPEEVKAVDLELGVKLEGEGGGEWLFRIAGGELRVEPGSRERAAFTLVQSVDDWRGALWEGRGGIVGRQASAVFRPGEPPPAPDRGMGGTRSPAALARLQGLDGMIQMVVTGDGDDWGVAFKLGPGEIPAEPSATVTLSAADVAAMDRGELNPIEAFMAGRIQIAGDMNLVMQVQAIQMQAATATSQGSSS